MHIYQQFKVDDDDDDDDDCEAAKVCLYVFGRVVGFIFHVENCSINFNNHTTTTLSFRSIN